MGFLKQPVQQSGRLILLCGLPGSGKTTTARQMATQLQAVRLNPDDWFANLQLDAWDAALRVRLERQFWELSKELLTLGQTVILEWGFWARVERDEKLSEARALGAAVELHYLVTSLDELWSRLASRNKSGLHGAVKIQRAQLEEFAGRFQAPNAAELELYDPPLQVQRLPHVLE